jgi:uncharacterized protein (DUF433 family)
VSALATHDDSIEHRDRTAYALTRRGRHRLRPRHHARALRSISYLLLIAFTGAIFAGWPATDVIKNRLPMKFSRITIDPRQMDGVPCIRGLRIPVATVVGMVADGMTREEILKAYPDLKAKDVEEALRYAAEAVRERELPLRSAS